VSTVTVVLGDDGIMPAAPAAGGGTAPAPAATPAPTGPATNYSDTVCIN
jgi:hypothetical protein